MSNLLKKIKTISDYLLLILLFFLPWQTRLISVYGELNGYPNEFLTLSIYGTEILLWLAVLSGMVGLFGQKEILKKVFSRDYFKSNFWRLLAAGIFLFFIFWLLRPEYSVSWQYISRLVYALLLFVLILRSRFSAVSLSLVIWLSGVWQGLIGFSQFLTQHIAANKWLGMAAQQPFISGTSVIQTMDERWLRAYGSFGSPNSLGIYLAVLFVLGLVLYEKNITAKYKSIFLLGQSIILIGLLLSFSRGAWLAATIGIVVFLILNLRKNIGSILKPFSLYILVLLVFLISCQQLVVVRLSGSGVLENISFGERRSQYSEMWQIFKNHPWHGTGAGLYTIALSKFIPIPVYGAYQPIHNIYFLMLAEMGVAGFVLYALVLIFLLREVIRKNIFYLPIIMTLIIAGLFDHWLWSMFTGIVFWWIVWGMGVKGSKF